MFVRGRDDTTGLPIGVLLTGQRFREDLCLDAAEAVEGRLRVACLDLTDNARPTSDNRIYCENLFHGSTLILCKTGGYGATNR